MAERDLSIRLKAIDEASNTFKQVGASAEGSSKFLSIAKGSMVALGTATATATASLALFAKSAISEAIQAEASQTRLVTILRNSVDASDAQISALNSQADALERVGVVSGQAVQQAQGQLATFDLQVDSIQRLIPSILDYAVAEKGASVSSADLQSMTNGLAQALNGNYSSLTRSGFVLDEYTKKTIESGTEQEKVEAIVSVLNSTYAGMNEQMRNTTQGGIIAMQNAFGKLKETIGTDLLPILTPFIERLNALLLSVVEVYGVLGGIEGIRDTVVSSIQAMIVKFDQKTLIIMHLKKVWADISKFFMEQVKPSLDNLLEAIKPYLPALQLMAELVGTVLVAAFHILIELIKMVVLATLTLLKGAIDAVTTALEIGTKSWDMAVGAFKNVVAWGQKVIDMYNAIVDAARRAAEAISRAVSSGVGGAVSGVSSFVSKVTPFADGGIVTRPTLAMIGEAGESEAVIPLSKFGSLFGGMGGGGAGNTVNVTIEGGNYLSEDVADQLGNVIVRRLQGKFIL